MVRLPTRSRSEGIDRRRFLGGLLGWTVASRAWATAPGALADLEIVGLDGVPGRLSIWQGPMLINLWATWCAPCREEMPALQVLADRTARSGIPVVALSFDSDLNLVREFVLRFGLTLPLALTRDARHAEKALGVAAVPTTLLVDEKRRVIQRYVGPRDWAAPDWPARLARTLAAAAGEG